MYLNPTSYAIYNIPWFFALFNIFIIFFCYPLFISNICLGCGEPKLPVILDTRTSTEREGSDWMGQIREDWREELSRRRGRRYISILYWLVYRLTPYSTQMLLWLTCRRRDQRHTHSRSLYPLYILLMSDSHPCLHGVSLFLSLLLTLLDLCC